MQCSEEHMIDLISAVPLGVGATAIMDLWGLARRPLLGQSVPDYRMLGRWVGLMGRGRFRHKVISEAPPVHGERALGWAVHYLTGIIFAALLLVFAGHGWLQHPEPGAALATGVLSVAAPFLLMHPAMGAGIASRRTSNPARARAQSLLTHAVFGAGLYLTALILPFINRQEIP
jgi:hypothetical protein